MPPKKKAREGKKFDSTYLVCKWLTHNTLKTRIAKIKKMDFSKEKLSSNTVSSFSIYALFNGGRSADYEQIQVNEFWEESNTALRGIGEAQIKGVLILQAAFKSWIILKNVRKLWKIGGHSSEDRSSHVQEMIRVWKARQIVNERAREKLKDELDFQSFCKEMMTGKDVIMFGRQYGNQEIRRLKFDPTGSFLTYHAGNSFNTRTVNLKLIYKVTPGPSGYMYPLSRIVHSAWCFHIELLGGRLLDFEALTKEDSVRLVKGFRRLRMLCFTQAAFFIDKEGIPRRAGPSVIWNAIGRQDEGEKSFRSEAEEMRFRLALKALLREYENWNQAEEKEKEEYQVVLAAWRRKRQAQDEATIKARGGVASNDDVEEEEEEEDEDESADAEAEKAHGRSGMVTRFFSQKFSGSKKGDLDVKSLGARSKDGGEGSLGETYDNSADTGTGELDDYDDSEDSSDFVTEEDEDDD